MNFVQTSLTFVLLFYFLRRPKTSPLSDAFNVEEHGLTGARVEP